MAFIGLPLIGAAASDLIGFISTHPSLVHEVMGHALAHSMMSSIRRAGRGMSRRQMRRAQNMRRRWFVDNIIMHHKRIHDRNREMIVNDARARVVARRQISRSVNKEMQKGANLWQEKVKIKEKSQEVRGRVDSRRLRARSRWLSVAQKLSG